MRLCGYWQHWLELSGVCEMQGPTMQVVMVEPVARDNEGLWGQSKGTVISNKGRDGKSRAGNELAGR